jgi:hypothetical protein
MESGPQIEAAALAGPNGAGKSTAAPNCCKVSLRLAPPNHIVEVRRASECGLECFGEFWRLDFGLVH